MATAASKTRTYPAPDPQRLYEATAAAAEFYTDQLPGHQPAMDYLHSRGIADAAAPGSPWQIGVAPAGWRGLLNHLAPRFSVEELLAAGLLTHNRTGGLIDRFRDRLVFPIPQIMTVDMDCNHSLFLRLFETVDQTEGRLTLFPEKENSGDFQSFRQRISQ